MILRSPKRINTKAGVLWAHGEPGLLRHPLHAILCSNACPGNDILRAMDLAQSWRCENLAVISSFHTPVEKECLRVFLRGPQPLVYCPARGIDPFRISKDWEVKFELGQILILSPFSPDIHRPTKPTAIERTRLILQLATRHTIIHASKGGVLESVFKEMNLPAQMTS